MDTLRRTVAVIDDDASLRRSVVRLLNAYGFPAIEYSSAEAFLRRDLAPSIDCLVLDIDLGGMSGLELQARLKVTGWNLPVIFITALEDERLRIRAERTGCVAYMRKPFSGAELISVIVRELNR
ncbi:two-component system response regulator [Rhizobium sp. R72]|uniref:response regulator transcription factor n=1 Tax=unclassified Rhizobium TaxID=2613769 RepID=UPI000B532ECD|nr:MULTISPECIES: response regulator [unclassified Rhizobium]OWW04605.1 two-component system response regulator [Rhizobium sp. R72]OWW05662.1 two-component system response regulator [Rhizobium sp. R711]